METEETLLTAFRERGPAPTLVRSTASRIVREQCLPCRATQFTVIQYSSLGQETRCRQIYTACIHVCLHVYLHILNTPRIQSIAVTELARFLFSNNLAPIIRSPPPEKVAVSAICSLGHPVSPGAALTPLSGRPFWQTDTRLTSNPQSQVSPCAGSFSATTAPRSTCWPGLLRTDFNIM